MAKLRHIAMVVEEMEKTAQFYEKSFGMKRVRQSTRWRPWTHPKPRRPSAPNGTARRCCSRSVGRMRRTAAMDRGSHGAHGSHGSHGSR